MAKYNRTKLAATDYASISVPAKKDEETASVVRARITEVAEDGSISAKATVKGKEVSFKDVPHSSDATDGKPSWFAFNPAEKLELVEEGVVSLSWTEHK